MAGGLDQLDRAAVVHGLLALRAAARAGAGGEDDGLRLADGLGDPVVVGLLEVADDRLERSGLANLLGVLGVADQGADLVPRSSSSRVSSSAIFPCPPAMTTRILFSIR